MVVPGSSSTSAHPSIRDSWEATSISCNATEVGGGSASFVVDVSAYQAWAGAWFWANPADPEVDPPTWFPKEGQVVISDDGSRLEGTIDLYEWVEPQPEAIGPLAVPGEYVGQAVLSLTLTPDGEPEYWRTCNPRHPAPGPQWHRRVVSA